MTRLGLLLLTLALPMAVAAQQTLRSERLDEALRAMLISLAQDPLFADEADFDLVYLKQPEAVINLGAICGNTQDADIDRKGLPVIAVTPGSTGAAMGLRAGDRILEVNGHSLLGLGHAASGEALAALRIEQALADVQAGETVTLEINRGGAAMKLSAPLQKWRLPQVQLAISMPPGASDVPDEPAPTPAAEPCGTVTLYEPPPDEFGLYPAYLTGINEDRGGAILRHFQYLAPGQYELLVNDLIPSRELRLRHTRFSRRRSAKTLELEVVDGMIYHVAAKLLFERKAQGEHEEYWQPVVWRSEPGFCKGRSVQR